MVKILMGLLAMNIFLLNECNTMKIINRKTYLGSTIYINNEKVSLSYDESENLIIVVEKLLHECNDLYELIITDELINDIKQNENYLEISYPEKRELKVGEAETLEIFNLLIPLSGRYISSNQLIFFCGYPQFSSGPYINDKGYIILNEMIRNKIAL